MVFETKFINLSIFQLTSEPAMNEFIIIELKIHNPNLFHMYVCIYFPNQIEWLKKNQSKLTLVGNIFYRTEGVLSQLAWDELYFSFLYAYNFVSETWMKHFFSSSQRKTWIRIVWFA